MHESQPRCVVGRRLRTRRALARTPASSIALAALAGVLAWGANAAAQDRQYTWSGEIVSVDATASVITVSAPVEAHVFRYVERFSDGDQVVMIWAPSPDDDTTTDAIRYLELRADSILDYGYVLPVEFVSADAAGQRLVFRTSVPPGTAAEALAPGTRISVTSPFRQEGDTATISALEVSPAPAADAAAAVAAHRPIVRMTITGPGGDTHQIAGPESGLARIRVEGIEYAFRPTIRDSAPWTDVAVTVFRMDPAVENLGRVDVTPGSAAVETGTTPSFSIAVTEVSMSDAP